MKELKYIFTDYSPNKELSDFPSKSNIISTQWSINTDDPIVEGYKFRLRNKSYVKPVQETVQAKTVSTPKEQSKPAMIVTTPEKKAELSKPAATSTAKKGKRYSDKNEFIKDMTTAYTKVLTDRGISADYAKMLVAQDALESNWGKSSLAEYFNFGGVKAIAGTPFVEKETNEYDAIRGMHKTKAKFRKFNSLEDYANYKINLLSGKRYQAFTGDISQFYNRVKAGGYATDPNYVSKLMNVYNSSVFSAKQGGSMPSKIDMLVAKFNEQFNK